MDQLTMLWEYQVEDMKADKMANDIRRSPLRQKMENDRNLFMERQKQYKQIVTEYLKLKTQIMFERAVRLLENTGITATAGIGTNLYLAKVAMDIVAKRKPSRNTRSIARNHTRVRRKW